MRNLIQIIFYLLLNSLIGTFISLLEKSRNSNSSLEEKLRNSTEDSSFTQAPIMGGIGLPLVVARVCRVIILMFLFIANFIIFNLFIGKGYVITKIGTGSVKLALSGPLNLLMFIVALLSILNLIVNSYNLAKTTYRLLSYFILPFFPNFIINYNLYFDTEAIVMLTTILNLRKTENIDSKIKYEYELIDYCMLIFAAIGQGLKSVIELTITYGFIRLGEIIIITYFL